MFSLRSTGMILVSSLALGGCVLVPPPANDVALKSSLESPLEPQFDVALDVTTTATPEPATENEAPLDPTEAAAKIGLGLQSELAGYGLFNAVVSPGAPADYDMTVTITEFDDETLIPGKTQALNGDGLNQMTAVVVLQKRGSDAPPFEYLVEASAPSESYYNPSYGNTGIEPMLDEAVDGIVDGLEQGIDGGAEAERSNVTEAPNVIVVK